MVEIDSKLTGEIQDFRSTPPSFREHGQSRLDLILKEPRFLQW